MDRPYFFEYTDKQGHYYVGNEAYVKAINDGYFDLIELDYGNTLQTDFLHCPGYRAKQ